MNELREDKPIDAAEAKKKVRGAAFRASQAAAHVLANGADADEIAQLTAGIMDALTDEEKMRHLQTVGEMMTPEERRQAIAALEAMNDEDDEDDPKV